MMIFSPAFRKASSRIRRVERLVVVNQLLKHLRVGLEGDLGAGAVGLTHDGHLLGTLPRENFIS